MIMSWGNSRSRRFYEEGKLSKFKSLDTDIADELLATLDAATSLTALRLARYFGNSAQFWMNLQSRYDLAVVKQNIGAKVIAEVKHSGDVEQSATL
jgi:addiction module HigA family antidote